MSGHKQKDPSQYPSWFDRYGDKQYRSLGLVAQIFFQTAEHKLDQNDCAVLNELAVHYQVLLLGQPVQFRFVGHADYRGSEQYNLGLGERRAREVKHFVDRRLAHCRFYASFARSLGESPPSGPLAGDRRVDVFASVIGPRPPIVVEPTLITGEYKGPLSNRFKFRTLAGGSVGKFVVGVQSFSFQIRNSRTGRTATYTYTGIGPGFGLPSVNRPTDWDEKQIKFWLDVGDFEGNGRVLSLGVGKGGTAMVFDGPKERGTATESIALGFEGWDFLVGFEADAAGYFHLR